MREAAAKFEHLEKPSLTVEELKELVNLFPRPLGHPLTGSADNDPRKGFLSFYWKGRSMVIPPGTGRGARIARIGPHNHPILFKKDRRGIRESASEG